MGRHLLALLLATAACATALDQDCTPDEILACSQKIIIGRAQMPRQCGDAEEPTYNSHALNPDRCCPSCRKSVAPQCQVAVTRVCAANEVPQRKLVDGCMTCYHQCSAAQKRACPLSATLRSCGPGEEPVYTKSCCLSCIPGCQNNQTKVDQCQARLNGPLEECPSSGLINLRLAFDPHTCCGVCRKPTRAATFCSVPDFKTCLTDSRTRECASGEVPVAENGQCCRSCRRVTRRAYCEPEKVGKCAANAPTCRLNEKPANIEGQCCLSCRVPRPVAVCPTACAEGQVCARGTDAVAPATFADKCRNVVRDRYRIKGQYNTPLYRMNNDQVRHMVVELVARYCDRTQNEAICAAFFQTVHDYLSTAIIDGGSGSTGMVLDVSVPDVRVATLAYDSTVTLLTKAIKDEESGLGFTVTNNAGRASHSPFLLAALSAFLMVGMAL